jgi:hypothetical protein
MGTHRSHCAHIYMWRLGKRSSKRDQHQRRSDRSSIIDQGLFVTNIKSICHNCHGNVELQVEVKLKFQDLILIDASDIINGNHNQHRGPTSAPQRANCPTSTSLNAACLWKHALTRCRWKPTHVTQGRKIQIQTTTLPAVPGHP